MSWVRGGLPYAVEGAAGREGRVRRPWVCRADPAGLAGCGLAARASEGGSRSCGRGRVGRRWGRWWQHRRLRGRFVGRRNTRTATIEVNPVYCARFGFCEQEAPELFALRNDGGLASTKDQDRVGKP